MQFSRALNDARVEKEAAIAQAVAQAKAEKMEAAADERQEQLIKVTGKTTHSFFEWQCVWFIYLFIIQYWYICFGDYRDTCTLIGRGCIISHSNSPMQGSYSWGAKFKNGCFAFCQY